MIVNLSMDERVAASAAANIIMETMVGSPQAEILKAADKKLRRGESDYTREEVLCMGVAAGAAAMMGKENNSGQNSSEIRTLEALSDKFKTYLK